MGEHTYAVTESDIQKLNELLGEVIRPTVPYLEDQLGMANEVISKNKHAAICASDILNRIVRGGISERQEAAPKA